MTPPPSGDDPIKSDADVRGLWLSLVSYLVPRPRSLYLVFLDGSGRPLKQIVPIDDLPVAPDREFVMGLAGVVDSVVEAGPAATVLCALSRTGADAVSELDRAWAAMLREHLDEWMAGRSVTLVTASGLRAIRATPWEPSKFRYVQRRPAYRSHRPMTRRR